MKKTLLRAGALSDAHDRPIATRLISGTTVQSLGEVSYDALGRVECTAQRMNPAMFGATPVSACTPHSAGSFGPDRITRTTYDAIGRATEVRTGVGVSGTNGAGEIEATTSYRPNGQVETLTDGEDNRTTYVYDAHDRLYQTRYPSPSTDGVSSTTDYDRCAGHGSRWRCFTSRSGDGSGRRRSEAGSSQTGYSYLRTGRSQRPDACNWVKPSKPDCSKQPDTGLPEEVICLMPFDMR